MKHPAKKPQAYKQTITH